MPRLWIIVWNTFASALRRKVLYVGIGATLVFSLPSIATFFQSQGLSVSDLMQLQALQLNGTVTLFRNWTLASIMLGVALGSLVIQWEIQERTILGVLARPVGRAEFLAAKWLGGLTTTLLFLAAGIVVGRLYSWDLNVPILPLLNLALLGTVISIVCFSAVSLILSLYISPVTASAVAIFMYLAPDILRMLFNEQRGIAAAYVKNAALAMYYLFPAGLEVNLVSESFGKIMMQPDYPLYTRVFVENSLYGVFVFLAACYLFNRREIQT